MRSISTSWVEVLTREVRSIVQLNLHDLDYNFPLQRVLVACGKLRSLHIGFSPYSIAIPLNCVGQHASHVTKLALENHRIREDLSYLWQISHSLKHFTVTMGLIPFPGDRLYDGIAHYCSRLHTLDLGELEPEHLSSALTLCEQLGDCR